MEEHLEYADTESRTELSAMGKYALIDRLTRPFSPQLTETLQGVGDDCAVVDCGAKLRLATTSTMVEGTSFDMTYTPLKHLGYKAVARALSNIAAMNGQPRQVLLSVAASNRFSLEALEELYAGVRHCCQRYGVDLVGGETTPSVAGLTLTATALGEADPGRIAYRKGAKRNDLLCVSGDLGSAYAGLLILEREKVTFQANPRYQPELSDFDYVLERYLKPEPRMDIVEALRKAGVVPTAMTDVSAGLASDIIALCRASRCGAEVYEERIPIDYQTTHVCTDINRDLLPETCALNGGEDYELLFTVDQKDYDKVSHMEGVSIIGYMTDEQSPIVMVTPQNTTIELSAPGWKGESDD